VGAGASERRNVCVLKEGRQKRECQGKGEPSFCPFWVYKVCGGRLKEKKNGVNEKGYS